MQLVHRSFLAGSCGFSACIWTYTEMYKYCFKGGGCMEPCDLDRWNNFPLSNEAFLTRCWFGASTDTILKKKDILKISKQTLTSAGKNPPVWFEAKLDAFFAIFKSGIQHNPNLLLQSKYLMNVVLSNEVMVFHITAPLQNHFWMRREGLTEICTLWNIHSCSVILQIK